MCSCVHVCRAGIGMGGSREEEGERKAILQIAQGILLAYIDLCVGGDIVGGRLSFWRCVIHSSVSFVAARIVQREVELVRRHEKDT